MRKGSEHAVSKLATKMAAAGGFLAATCGANAGLVQNGALDLTGEGFGNTPVLLTVQQQGANATESGATGISGGASVNLVPGISDAAVFSGNGLTNAGGDTVGLGATPSLGDLGWAAASDVNLLFSTDQANGAGITVNDLTLKFYSGDTLVAAIDGSFSIASTLPSLGSVTSAGFWISVDGAQQTFLNDAVFGQASSPGFRIALEATVSGASAGAESFAAIGLAPLVPEPQTYALMLAGLGALGLRLRGRKKARKT
jgi:hypothetical protein